MYIYIERERYRERERRERVKLESNESPAASWKEDPLGYYVIMYNILCDSILQYVCYDILEYDSMICCIVCYTILCDIIIYYKLFLSPKRRDGRVGRKSGQSPCEDSGVRRV